MKMLAAFLMAGLCLAAEDNVPVLEGDLTRGVGEVHVMGGVSSNIPIRVQFPVTAVGAAFGLNHWLGLTADYAYHRVSSELIFGCRGLACGTFSQIEALHEVTAGPRISFTNCSGVVPYATGLVGFGLARTTVAGPAQDRSSDTRLLAGAGAGVDVKIYRGIGIVWDTRVLYRLELGWYGRTSLGMYLRGR